MQSKRDFSKTIHLIRHGQTQGNALGAWLGARSADELNDIGRMQAKDTVKTLQESGIQASKIFSSPTPRSLQHAEILQRHINLPIEKLNSLTEMNLGILEDRSRAEGILLVPEEVLDWEYNMKEFHPPLGESALEAAERFYETVELIAENSTIKDIIFVSHGIVIKLFLARILKTSIELGESKIKVPATTHGSITVVKYNNHSFEFVKVVENAYPDSPQIAAYG